MMRCVWGRGLGLAGLLTLLGFPAMAAPVPENGFLTNLALLDRLTREAVQILVDSLDVRPGETITLVPATGHEGNEFIADALARDLARRGITVRMALVEAPAPERPAEPPPGGNAGGGAQNQHQNHQNEQGEPPPGFPQDTPSGGGADTTAAKPDTTVFGSALGSNGSNGSNGSTGSIGAKGTNTGGGDASGSAKGETEASGQQPAGAPAVPPSTPETPREERPRPPSVRAYPDGLVLEYRILEFGVTYPALKRRYLLFGGASVRRLGGVYLQASRIQGPAGTVQDVANGQSHWEDRLTPRSRTLAEGSSYPFMKPSIPPANVGRYIEPVAVLGIVTSLVYLFYQNQH